MQVTITAVHRGEVRDRHHAAELLAAYLGLPAYQFAVDSLDQETIDVTDMAEPEPTTLPTGIVTITARFRNLGTGAIIPRSLWS